VSDDELVTIGRFAHISGLSMHTVRHYDDVGLLAPVDVDSVCRPVQIKLAVDDVDAAVTFYQRAFGFQ
jgi:hypothetical protein